LGPPAALDRWHDFEAKAEESALREWCKLNSIELDGLTDIAVSTRGVESAVVGSRCAFFPAGGHVF
jgi:hypothetical protein